MLATIARVNHLIPSRTQKWNLLALMVVWDYPCESKSSPAHYSKHPQPNGWGVFLCLLFIWFIAFWLPTKRWLIVKQYTNNIIFLFLCHMQQIQPENGFLAPYGSEEFAILLPEISWQKNLLSCFFVRWSANKILNMLTMLMRKPGSVLVWVQQSWIPEYIWIHL